MAELCDIGLIGLAVMGQNLVLNMNDHGFKVAVFNRTVSKVDDFINNEAKGTKVVGAHTMAVVAGRHLWRQRLCFVTFRSVGMIHARPSSNP